MTKNINCWDTDDGVPGGEPGPVLGEPPLAGYCPAPRLARRQGTVEGVREENHSG